MMIVAVLMLRKRPAPKANTVHFSQQTAPWLIIIGFFTGALAGFFGIGGGFLIVPGLILATGMPILNAIGLSLVAVTAFGVTTAANYARSGAVDWTIAALLLGGGVFGGFAGSRTAHALANRKQFLNIAFAALIFLVAIYMLVHSVA